jgi:hypothetical protein
LIGGVPFAAEGKMRDMLRRSVRKVLAGATGSGALLFAYWGAGGRWGVAAASSPGFSPPSALMWTTALLLVAWTMMMLGPIDASRGEVLRRLSRLACCVTSVALLLIASTFLQSEILWVRLVCGSVMMMAAGATLLVRDETAVRRLFVW